MDKSKVNLCEVCKFDVPTCKAKNPKFGTGKGNDNVYDCDTFRQLQYLKTPQSTQSEVVPPILETDHIVIEDKGVISGVGIVTPKTKLHIRANAFQSEAVDKDREKDINQLCKAVLELAPRNTGDSGTGAECPFCFEEGNWDGDISDLKHDLDCAYLIAKDLSTNLNSG